MTYAQGKSDKKKIHPSEKQVKNVEKIKILSHVGTSWQVELFFPMGDVSEDQLSIKLREVKRMLEKQYDLTGSTLQYKRMLGSEVTNQGVTARLLLEKVLVSKGKPVFKFEKGRSPEGLVYSDMALFADLFYLDEFEKVLTKDKLIGLLKRNNVPDDLIDFEVVDNAIKVMNEKQAPVTGLRLAAGIFPELGVDSEVEFYFHANPGIDNHREYISSKKVDEGDLLCSKTLPKEGKRQGLTVKGKKIPPGKGLDVKLVPGKNVKSNIEGTSLNAVRRGLVVVNRKEKTYMTPQGQKIVPELIEVRVDPLLVIEATDEIVELTTNESVEIRGNLKIGSRIITTGEVHVEGDINEDSIVQASQDIVVSGDINNAQLSSDRSIVAQKGVNNGKITAGENVVIHGTAANSSITGKTVYSNEIVGGDVTAGKQVTVNELGADENGLSATICVGMREFLNKKVEENVKIVSEIKSNINRLKEFFGEDIIKDVSTRNLQQMLVKFISQMPKGKNSYLSQKKVAAIKKLLSNVESLRNILREKEVENIQLRKQIERGSKEKKLVVVKEKVSAKSRITIDGTTRTVQPQPGPLKLEEKDLRDMKKNS